MSTQFSIRRFAIVIALCAVVALLGAALSLSMTASGSAHQSAELQQFGSKRKIKHNAFSGTPLVVHQVRNIDADESTWFRDMEIEVKNVSNQPIYFVDMNIEFPGIPAPNNGVTGFRLKTGNPRLGNLSEIAEPDDVPAIEPGGTHVFRIPVARAEGFETMKRKLKLTPKSYEEIVIRFERISFGDGTGYVMGGHSGKRNEGVRMIV